MELKIKKTTIYDKSTVKIEMMNGDYLILDPLELFYDLKNQMIDKEKT